MSEIQFEDNRIQVKAEIQDSILAFLDEIGGEFVSQTARNSRVKTGQTKGSWDYLIDEGNLEVTIGSSLENTIWEEFGTGEYALEGNGRKGGWYYVDEMGNGHFTHGKTPNRAFHTAMESLKPKIQQAMEEKLKGLN